MVGSVVDKGLAAQNIPLTINRTVTVNGSLNQVTEDNSDHILQVKLGLAMAVTFAVGCVQVGVSLGGCGGGGGGWQCG